MAEKHNFLAFDCGATSGRAVLATFQDGSFDMKEVYRFPSGIIELNGKYYWDILAIYDHFRKCLAQLGREGVQLDSIGIDKAFNGDTSQWIMLKAVSHNGIGNLIGDFVGMSITDGFGGKNSHKTILSCRKPRRNHPPRLPRSFS